MLYSNCMTTPDTAATFVVLSHILSSGSVNSQVESAFIACGHNSELHHIKTSVLALQKSLSDRCCHFPPKVKIMFAPQGSRPEQ